MRKRWLLPIALIPVALAVYFEPTHSVRGWLHGEAFYDGRPTSYWRDIVERDLRDGPDEQVAVADPPGSWRSAWDQCKAWIGLRSGRDSSRSLLEDDAAQAVLEDLARDTDPHIAGFSRQTREIEPVLLRFRGSCMREAMVISQWRHMIATHRIGAADAVEETP
jgi:hypothetical protein